MSSRDPRIERLFDACANADEAGIAAALQAGADANGLSEDYDGTALANALTANSPRGAALLVEAGADLKAKDAFGYTPLHFAAYLGDAELIAQMLLRGADPSVVSKRAHPAYEFFKKASTPLDIARRAGETALIAALTAGAAPAAPGPSVALTAGAAPAAGAVAKPAESAGASAKGGAASGGKADKK